jgi:electron transfer flavoprotein alpha subunit
MSGPVLVFIEHVDGEPDRLSLEAVTFARELARTLGVDLEAVLLGSSSATVAGRLASTAVARTHAAADSRLDAYAPAAWAAALGSLLATRLPTSIVAAGSDRGNEVLAHLAARRGLPMAANVLAAKPGSSWSLVRQRWAGSLLEDAALDAPVRLLTVAPHAVAPAELGEAGVGSEAGSAGGAATAHVEPFDPQLTDADLAVRVVGHEAKTSQGVSLTDAKVVVGGGRGVGSADGFAALEELAGLLGGAVGGSRVVTSLGWRPHADQIGQTGLRIAPDLYIACGISGAIQHIVGCKAAKRILAINTDAESPIMAVADYAVIGDLKALVPAISEEIRRRRSA